MGNGLSRRARRRTRGRNNANPNLVYWMGEWMVRTVWSETIEFKNGIRMEFHNETFNRPHVIREYAERLRGRAKEDGVRNG